jgi:hypothetical protein
MTTTEGEMAAIIFGLRHFWVYLRGRPEFIVRTDHRALTWLESLTPTSGKLARWLYTVRSEYNLKIKHREGKSHLNADSLSRAVAKHLKDAYPEETYPEIESDIDSDWP